MTLTSPRMALSRFAFPLVVLFAGALAPSVSPAQEKSAGIPPSFRVDFAFVEIMLDEGVQLKVDREAPEKLLDMNELKGAKDVKISDFQIFAFEGLESQLHIGRREAVPTGQQTFGADRRGIPAFTMQEYGTTIVATLGETKDGATVVEYSFERTTPGEPHPDAEGPPPPGDTTSARSTLNVAHGAWRLAAGMVTTSTGDPTRHHYLLVRVSPE